MTQVVDDSLGLFAQWVERKSLVQICNQCIRFGWTFKSMHLLSNYPCSIFIFEYCIVWESLNFEFDLELLLIRDCFPSAGTTL